jgi:hypothetical protein
MFLPVVDGSLIIGVGNDYFKREEKKGQGRTGFGEWKQKYGKP